MIGETAAEDGAVVGGNVGAEVVGDAEGITLGSEVGDSVGTYVGEVVVGVSEGTALAPTCSYCFFCNTTVEITCPNPTPSTDNDEVPPSFFCLS